MSLKQGNTRQLMIIFINDDRAYLAWVRSHRAGFVVDAPRTGRRRSILHTATCPAIRAGKRTHWTTGQRFKACSLDLTELAQWTRESVGIEASLCEACRPGLANDDSAGDHNGAIHLSPLSGNVLNYVLESAIVQLTNHDPDYHLTVSDIATCFGKSPAQLRPALERLAEAMLLEFGPPSKNARTFPSRATVMPTAAALRMLPAYAEASDDQLSAELAGLHQGAGANHPH